MTEVEILKNSGVDEIYHEEILSAIYKIRNSGVNISIYDVISTIRQFIKYGVEINSLQFYFNSKVVKKTKQK